MACVSSSSCWLPASLIFLHLQNLLVASRCCCVTQRLLHSSSSRKFQDSGFGSVCIAMHHGTIQPLHCMSGIDKGHIRWPLQHTKCTCICRLKVMSCNKYNIKI